MLSVGRHRMLLEKETYLITVYKEDHFVLNDKKYVFEKSQDGISLGRVLDLQGVFQGHVYNVEPFDLEKSVDVVMAERKSWDGKTVTIEGVEYTLVMKSHIHAYTLFWCHSKTSPSKELMLNSEGTFISSKDGWVKVENEHL